mgnify:CR=1 FL=1
MNFRVMAVLVALLFPTSASADILIHEIAWMGTEVSANDEWIELYNSGDDQSLEGWTLEATDGSPNITLSGTISSGGFFILERSDDTTIPTVTANLIYTGALSNSGEYLVLKNKNGEVVHEVNAQDGWQAGDNTTKDTMQWNGSSWVTGTPTPNQSNTQTATQTSEEEPEETTQSNSNNSGNGTNNTTTIPSALISPLPLSEVGEIRDFFVSPGTKRIVTVGQTVPFFGFIFDEVGNKTYGGKFEWSFGDGGSAYGEEVSHSYHYPGTYVVALNAQFYSEHAVAKTEIMVIEPNLEITDIGRKTKNSLSFVEVKNNSPYDLNLYNWKLFGDSLKPFVFPKDTIVTAGKSVIFPEEVTGVLTLDTAYLHDQKDTERARYTPPVSEQPEPKKPETIEIKEASIEPPQEKIVPLAPVQKPEPKEESKESAVEQAALVSESFVVEKPEGPLTKLLMLPVRLVRGIANLF